LGRSCVVLTHIETFIHSCRKSPTQIYFRDSDDNGKALEDMFDNIHVHKPTSVTGTNMLSAQQVNHFEAFGFLLLRELYSPEEMAELSREVAVLMETQPAKSDGPDFWSLAPFIEHSTTLIDLPVDDRIYQPMEQLLGNGFTWGGSEGVSGSFNETNDHQWHSDRGGQIDLSYRRIKIMIYLQSMRKETGALRVIPGSHHAPFHTMLLPLQEQKQDTSAGVFGAAGGDLPCTTLEVDPGDVVVFDHYLFHAVYGKQEMRRYVALKFAAKPETEVHYEALRAHRQDASTLHESLRHSEHPRVKGMVEGLLHWETKLG